MLAGPCLLLILGFNQHPVDPVSSRRGGRCSVHMGSCFIDKGSGIDPIGVTKADCYPGPILCLQIVQSTLPPSSKNQHIGPIQKYSMWLEVVQPCSNDASVLLYMASWHCCDTALWGCCNNCVGSFAPSLSYIPIVLPPLIKNGVYQGNKFSMYVL